MPASPGWYDASNVAIASPITVTGTGGSAGTGVTFKLINNKGGSGASAITNGRFLVMARQAGTADAYVATGIDALDRHFLEIKLVQGYNATFTATDWRQVGAGAPFDGLPPSIANDEGVECQIRANAPADTGTVDLDVKVILIDDRNTVYGMGMSVAGEDGIYSGIGDEGFSVFVQAANAVEDSGGVSDDIEVPDLVYIARGKVFTLRAHNETTTPASAGNNKYVLVYIDEDGAMQQLDGTETASALTEDDKPALPATGALVYAYVAVDDASTITDADITNAYTVGLFPFSSSGLTGTIGSGPYAFVDGSLIYKNGSDNVTLTASDVNYIWLLPSGSLEKTLTDYPSDGKALPLYAITTDGSGVTATEDRRILSGANDRQFIVFQFDGEIDTSTYQYKHLHSPREGWLNPLFPMSATLGSQGAGTGGSTVWEVDIERSASWDALFGTAADGPTIAYNAAAGAMIDASAVPDTWNVPRFARIRAKHNAIPSGSGGTEPNDSTLILEVLL